MKRHTQKSFCAAAHTQKTRGHLLPKQQYQARESVVAERTNRKRTMRMRLQCILHWEIVRKVKRASFPCVAFFPCRLTFWTISQYKIHWRGTACCVFCLCFQCRLSQAITLISPKKARPGRDPSPLASSRTKPGRYRSVLYGEIRYLTYSQL